MTYDLRRLRLHGLIQRLPRTHRYMVTLDGWQVAGFYNTPYHHVLRPGWTVLAVPSASTPEPIAAALRHLADATRDLVTKSIPTRTTPMLPPKLDRPSTFPAGEQG